MATKIVLSDAEAGIEYIARRYETTAKRNDTEEKILITTSEFDKEKILDAVTDVLFVRDETDEPMEITEVIKAIEDNIGGRDLIFIDVALNVTTALQANIVELTPPNNEDNILNIVSDVIALCNVDYAKIIQTIKINIGSSELIFADAAPEIITALQNDSIEFTLAYKESDKATYENETGCEHLKMRDNRLRG